MSQPKNLKRKGENVVIYCEYKIQGDINVGRHWSMFFSCILLQHCEFLQGREQHLFADCTLVLSTEYCYNFKDVFYI